MANNNNWKAHKLMMQCQPVASDWPLNASNAASISENVIYCLLAKSLSFTARDLIAHLSSAHNSLPSQNAAASPSPQSQAQATSSDDLGLCGRVKRVSGSSRNGGDDIAQELRQLRAVVLELKTGSVPSAARLEQMLGQLDSRVCRLEKQLEMALNRQVPHPPVPILIPTILAFTRLCSFRRASTTV